ncbi:MAG: hypothetical protein KI790_18250 [Cyclobacteriaceae bacterium]|nr:hypothetical protein [Cyclobacteriaceae bacterium HetDA_MAG_MS6]
MIVIIGILSGLLVALFLLIKMLPDKVQYIETVIIKKSARKIYDAIRYQEQLMQWSAWPKETKSDCIVENTDGQIGVQTVYLNKKGKKFGYQEITKLIENEQIDFYLKSFVAPFEKDVRLTFILREHSENETLVVMWFDEKLRKPHFLIAYFGGILKWVHRMHLKDLAYLKEYVEAL